MVSKTQIALAFDKLTENDQLRREMEKAQRKAKLSHFNLSNFQIPIKPNETQSFTCEFLEELAACWSLERKHLGDKHE